MVKKFPAAPRHPERICWGCDQYCAASDMRCGNGSDRTPHPAELFGEDWQDWAPQPAPAAPEEPDGSVQGPMNPSDALTASVQAVSPADADADIHISALDLQRPGYKAMWVGICLECLEFAVFFFVYFTARWHQPQAFQEGAARLWTLGGLLITLVMVSSGYMLTRMLHHLEAGRRKRAQVWMAAALATGLIYPVLKLLEWQWNLAQGLDASAGIFVVVYYYLTINHFIHASWGLMGMGWILLRMFTGSYSATDMRGPQSLAIYWHATDLVWLMIFALFYAFA